MIVVDMSYMYFRNVFAAQEFVRENPNVCAHLLINGLYSIIDKFTVNKDNPLVAAFDCKRNGSWRWDYYTDHSKQFESYENKTYKGHRVSNTSIPWKEVMFILEDIKQWLRQSTDVLVLEHDKAEADDIIYVISKENEKKGKSTIIVSEDKDFVQLISPLTSLYKPKKDEMIVYCSDT